MSLISYWRTKEVRWPKTQYCQSCITDLTRLLCFSIATQLKQKPTFWVADTLAIEMQWAIAIILLLEDIYMKRALQLGELRADFKLDAKLPEHLLWNCLFSPTLTSHVGYTRL